MAEMTSFEKAIDEEAMKRFPQTMQVLKDIEEQELHIHEHITQLKTKPIVYAELGIIKIGNNEPCDCGSGKKYKRCCKNKEVEKEIYNTTLKNN